MAPGYDVGSFTRMGPGFFPLALGITLIVLGLLILLFESPAPVVGSLHAWRPFLAVAGGILVWALFVESVGFFVACILQVILTSLALPAPKWRDILVLAAVLSIAGYLLFVRQLGVPLSAVG